jgi:peptide deformylase
MLRPIVRYPAAVLHAPAAPVTTFDADLDRLIDDMVDTIRGARHGWPRRRWARCACVIDLSVGRRGGDLHVLINPEFVSHEGMQLEEEGCLSVPGFDATVARPARAVVRALDRHGVERTIEGAGLLARAFQHEVDHLNGSLFLDHLRGIKRDIIVRKIRKLQREGKW